MAGKNSIVEKMFHDVFLSVHQVHTDMSGPGVWSKCFVLWVLHFVKNLVAGWGGYNLTKLWNIFGICEKHVNVS